MAIKEIGNFAQHFSIDIINIFQDIDVSSEAACEDKSVVIANSDFLNGLSVTKPFQKAIKAIEEKRIGQGKLFIDCAMLFSRQRSLGRTIPSLL